MVITRVTNASPDMILTPLDVNFHETKDGMYPGACRPFKKLKKQGRKREPQQIATKQCRTSGPPKSRNTINVEQVYKSINYIKIGLG